MPRLPARPHYPQRKRSNRIGNRPPAAEMGSPRLSTVSFTYRRRDDERLFGQARCRSSVPGPPAERACGSCRN